MPWTPEEFLALRARDTAGVEADPTPIAAGRAWVDGYLVDVTRLVAEHDALKAELERRRDECEVRAHENLALKQDLDDLTAARDGLRVERERLLQQTAGDLVALGEARSERDALKAQLAGDNERRTTCEGRLKASLQREQEM